jgi:hypothetical protein
MGLNGKNVRTKSIATKFIIKTRLESCIQCLSAQFPQFLVFCALALDSH